MFFTIFRWGFSIPNARAYLGKDLQEIVSHEYILKILLADFYIDIFHLDDYLNKQLTGSSENQFFSSFDRFRGGFYYIVVVIGHPWKGIKVSNEKKSKYLTANTKSWAKTKHVFVSTLFCGSNMLNRAFITKTTSGELGFHNRKSTQDDLLLTDVGVRFPFIGCILANTCPPAPLPLGTGQGLSKQGV